MTKWSLKHGSRKSGSGPTGYLLLVWHHIVGTPNNALASRFLPTYWHESELNPPMYVAWASQITGSHSNRYIACSQGHFFSWPGVAHIPNIRWPAPNDYHPSQDESHRPQRSKILQYKLWYIIRCPCEQNKIKMNTVQHTPPKFRTNKSDFKQKRIRASLC